jgi:hypothetical protein
MSRIIQGHAVNTTREAVDRHVHAVLQNALKAT